TPGPGTPGAPTTPGGAPGAVPPSLAAMMASMTGGSGGDPSPRPYGFVITPAARTQRGLVTTHLTRGRLYFEIPRAQMNRDMLIVRTLRGTQAPAGGLSFTTLAGNRLVRWERRENRVLLRGIEYRNVVADTTNPIARAVEIVTYAPIIAAFNVEAYGPDSSAVVEVSRLFTGGVSDLLTGGARASADPSRSFVESVAAYPRNVEIEASQTFGNASPFASASPAAALFGPTPTGTELYHFSLVRLPDVPMRPRLYDERVGYFNTQQADFGSREQRVRRVSFINRWRLECSDRREGNLCYPKHPITYYVDPATPTIYVPWVKKGIEEWQSAFEAAGFKQAIVAREVPRDSIGILRGENANVSMVRWVPSATENAVGPSTVDPRSGEILDADVQIFHNVTNLNRDWYFTQVGHLDPRAQHLPFPDSLMGRLMEFVVAHEVGHTMGLRHDMKGSSMYPMDSVRSASWVHRMGHSPSIMDYSRFNYVAQPEDHIALEDLVPRVGPYDRYAIMWGYTPIPGATSADAEKPTTDRWSRMQDSVPWYRFGGDEGIQGPDPGEANEAVGDQDAVRATALGIKNIRRVARLLEGATETRPGEPYDDLEEIYNRLVGQWALELGHVARIPGGDYKQEKYVGQKGEVYTRIPRARQKGAVAFLNANAFQTPEYLLDPSVLRKIEASGSIDRVGGAQRRILNTLLDNARLQRMVEQEGMGTDRDTYTVGEMLGDLRRGIWTELPRGTPIDPFRRRLQLAYLDVIGSKLNPGAAPTLPTGLPPEIVRFLTPVNAIDARALLRGELVDLDREIAGAVSRTSDRTSRLHLQGARDQIDRILHPDGAGRRVN
ncbi:MAG TPA: zinc-dependent metalloprotease, partial [Gemmatirosa sp.]